MRSIRSRISTARFGNNRVAKRESNMKLRGPIMRLLLSPGNRHHVSGPRLMTFDPIWMSSRRLGNTIRFSFSGPSGI